MNKILGIIEKSIRYFSVLILLGTAIYSYFHKDLGINTLLTIWKVYFIASACFICSYDLGLFRNRK